VETDLVNKTVEVVMAVVLVAGQDKDVIAVEVMEVMEKTMEIKDLDNLEKVVEEEDL
jgi:hypothetical protein